jgi:hypothetical protein
LTDRADLVGQFALESRAQKEINVRENLFCSNGFDLIRRGTPAQCSDGRQKGSLRPFLSSVMSDLERKTALKCGE